MTPKEYFDALAHFDWDYARSDDHKIFTAGHNRYNELRRLAEPNKALQRIWSSFIRYNAGMTRSKPRRPK